MVIATKELINLVIQFREAIDAAYDAGEFEKHISFNTLSDWLLWGCCGFVGPISS